MEVCIEFQHNGNSYVATIKIGHRKVKWTKVFLKKENSMLVDEILPVKATASTKIEEAAYWLHKLKRKLRKK